MYAWRAVAPPGKRVIENFEGRRIGTYFLGPIGDSEVAL